MKMKHLYPALALSLLAANPLHATEGAMGRPVSGASINPYAGMVPPLPGFSISVAEIYYDGSIGGSKTTPLGGNLTLDLDTKISFTNISLLYIWDTHAGPWNFASGVSLPLAWVQAEADVAVGPVTGHRKEEEFGLFDIVIVPIMASYHISQTDHLGLSFTVWAPTGTYDSSQLANLSLNNWTFIPGVSYTKLFPESDIELSANWAVQFYTENDATGYENGVVSDLEMLGLKRFKNGVGAGVVASWIYQLTDDEGDTADALDGFKGRACGVGPIVTYSTKVDGHLLDFNARWVHEFENRNRIEGDTFLLNASVKF